MSYSLSNIQQAIFEYISKYIDVSKKAPTVREIQKACGISSPSVVHYNLRILEREKKLTRYPEVARGLDIEGAIRSSENFLEIPIIGMISEKNTINHLIFKGLSQDDVYETVKVSVDLIKNDSDYFAVKVLGKSMLDALIDDQDILIIDSGKIVPNGSTILVWLIEQQITTLKKVYFKGNTVRLESLNNRLNIMLTEASNINIQGRIISVIRYFI